MGSVTKPKINQKFLSFGDALKKIQMNLRKARESFKFFGFDHTKLHTDPDIKEQAMSLSNGR